MSGITAALAALRDFILAQRAAAATAPEAKMLQGVYRGFAGEAAAPVSVEAAPAERLFVTPQKRIADYYAQKRASQTGEAPHVEMLLVDPFVGGSYGHSTMGTGRQPPMFTNARKLKPEDIVDRAQLYARGGLARYKECNCNG